MSLPQDRQLRQDPEPLPTIGATTAAITETACLVSMPPDTASQVSNTKRALVLTICSLLQLPIWGQQH